MSSTFFGLNIGASALTAFQASVNTTANNIANVKTPGYSRQETSLEASAALRVNARYGSTGTGVTATAITQQRDQYYDTKYWECNSSKGLYEEKLYYLSQFETYFKDDSTQQGFSTIFNKMFSGLDTLKNGYAADVSVRNQFVNQAQQLCTYFNSLSTTLTELQEDANEEIRSSVDSINAMSEKIALLNKEINRIEVTGGRANELRDERANLLDTLSQVVNVETNEYEIQNTNGENFGGTHYSVMINGQVLVDGNDCRKLECVSREQKVNQTDIDGLYNVIWADTKTNFAETNGTSGGSLKALFLVRDGNNNENLSGQVGYKTTNNTLVLDNPSVRDVNALNIPPEGSITINGKEYAYTRWNAELDAEGKITSFSFDLAPESTLSAEELSQVRGENASCGKAYDAMGVVYYQSQINEFLRNFTELFNGMEREGVTLDGEQMGSFFVANMSTGVSYDAGGAYRKSDGSYVSATTNPDGTFTTSPITSISSDDNSYYKMTASNIGVNKQSLKDPSYFSTTVSITDGTTAYDIIDKLKTLQSDVTVFRGNKASSFLETLLSDVTVDTDKTTTFYNNYNNLSSSIDMHRMSISGVDEDEEALNLVKFQNAYNMASKIVSVLSEMYSKLINECGVT